MSTYYRLDEFDQEASWQKFRKQQLMKHDRDNQLEYVSCHIEHIIHWIMTRVNLSNKNLSNRHCTVARMKFQW